MAGGVYQNWATDSTGVVLPAATVTIRDEVSGAVSTIWSDDALSVPQANPIAADANGFFRFYAAAGYYRIEASSGMLSLDPLRDVAIGDSQARDVGAAIGANVLDRDAGDARYLDSTELNVRLGTTGNLGTAAQYDITDFIGDAELTTRLGTTGNLGDAAQYDVGQAPGLLITWDDYNAMLDSDLNVRLGTTSNLGTMAQQDATGITVDALTVNGDSLLDGIVDIGAASAEAGEINIAGLTLDYKLRVSEFGAAGFVEAALHRHSTTIEPILLGYRSNSNDATHAAVVASMPLFSIYGGGRCATQYNAFGQIQIAAGATGTISDTSAPGRVDISTTRNGSILPTLTARFDEVGNIVNMAGTADQSYSRQVPSTGFAITIAAGVKTLVLMPAGTLATGTITMPAAPIDGQEVRVSSSQIVTALTVSANAGQTISNAPTTIAAGSGFAYLYNLANTNWMRVY